MKLDIIVNPIPDGDIPSLGLRPRKLGITLNVRRRLHNTKLTFEAPTRIDEEVVSKLIESLDIYYPELEVLEYINE